MKSYNQYMDDVLMPTFFYYKQVAEASQASETISDLLKKLDHLTPPKEPEGECRHGITSAVTLGSAYLVTKDCIKSLLLSPEERAFLDETARYMFRNRIFNAKLQSEIATAAFIKAHENGHANKNDSRPYQINLYHELEEKFGPQISLSPIEMKGMGIGCERMYELVSYMLSAAQTFGRYDFGREVLKSIGVDEDIFDYNVIDSPRKTYWVLQSEFRE